MINLGKWPTLRVVGNDITPAQAGDVLICTMPWFTGFAPHPGTWEEQAWQIGAEFGMPNPPMQDGNSGHSEWFRKVWWEWYPQFSAWRERYGVLDSMSLDGPANNLITSSYRSWCAWDGQVSGQFSIGKWVDQGEVSNYFTQVAERFPFLRLTADLISELSDQRGDTETEEGYTRAVRIQVANGQVDMIDPYEGDALVLPESYHRRVFSADPMAEQGVSGNRLREAFQHLTAGA